MNSNVDVVRELEVKNREIYFNKLVIDIDNNFDILKITISNMINLFTEELITKIMEIESSTINRGSITENVTSFQNGFGKNIMTLLTNRKEKMSLLISNINNVNYTSEIADLSAKVIENADKYYTGHVQELCDILDNNNDEFTKMRINDYLKINYYEKTISKLKEILHNTDTILVNNYSESYQKYLDLNAKTLK